MKEKRQAEIVRIISEQDVETQEQLLAQLELLGIGFPGHQGTALGQGTRWEWRLPLCGGKRTAQTAQPYRTAAQYFPGGSDLL